MSEHAKLTLRSCQTAPLGFTWDTVLPGFGLRVLASGRRSFVLRYRTRAGTDRLLTIGTLAEMHPEAAREEARKARVSAREGNDPRMDRKRARGAATLAELRDRFLRDHASQKKPGTARNYEILWRRHILPTLGESTRAVEVQEADILRLRERMREMPFTFNRAREVLTLAYGLAAKWGVVPKGYNPAEDVADYPEPPRMRVLTDSEIARLWSALDSHPVPMFAALVRLLLLSGRRLDELRLARWSAIDLDRATLTLADSKVGAITHALPDAAVELLRDMSRTSVFVFPGKTGGPLGGHQKWWRRLRAKLGFPDVRLHDLRHTAGSYAHAAGLTQREVADMLGHRQISTAARYIHGVGTAGQGKASVAAGQIVKMARG